MILFKTVSKLAFFILMFQTTPRLSLVSSLILNRSLIDSNLAWLCISSFCLTRKDAAFFFLVIVLMYSLLELKSSPVDSILFRISFEFPDVVISQCCCLEIVASRPILCRAFCTVAASLSVITYQ